MTNKKKILIETLHGSLEPCKQLPALIDKETIYDETGHVDTEFLTAILEWMSVNASIAIGVQKSLNRLLGIEENKESKKGTADSGKNWSVEEILRHCTLENGLLKLPNVQFCKKSYAEAKKWIEEAGGSWQGGKAQGFTFPFNPERVFSILKEGKRCNLQQEYQFFETPADVADWLVMLAGGIHEDDTVLEPSAGRGALIKAIHRACPSVTVECYELMPENREFLHTLSNVILLDEDFTKDSVGSYTKIIANPPFTGNQDIEHVRLMYDRLEEGGTLAAITSQHWKFASEKKCIDFRNWLKEVHGEVFEISAGEFKESGTSISTMAVVIKKKSKSNITELINKQGLEKEMRETPDYILAEICIDAMAVFSEAIARRDEWHEFRKADEKSSQDAKHNYQDDCNICKDRFKCADFMRTQPIANLIQRFKTTTDKEKKTAIAGLLKQINADASGKPQNDIPEEVKEVAGKLAKVFGECVEIHRIEIPEKKRKFRKKPRKEQGNETRRISRRECSICKRPTGIHAVTCNENPQ